MLSTDLNGQSALGTAPSTITTKAAKVHKRVAVCAYGAKLLGGESANQLALSILRAQNRLWNAFVQIENESREAYRAALVQSDPELARLTQLATAEELNVQTLLDARNAERARERKKAATNAQSYAHLIKEASERLKQIRTDMKECKARAKEAAKPLTDAAELTRRAKINAAVKDANLWWCHSQTVVQKYDVARVRAMKEGAMLRWHRFDGDGSMGVRFNAEGGSLRKIYAGKTTLITMRSPTPEELGRALEVKADGGRRVVVQMRAGAKEEDKTKPFLQFMVTMHAGNVFPQDLPLKTVSVTRTMHVNKAEWKMVFTFAGDADEPGDMPELACGAAGVDFGFRVVNQYGQKGLRVATISYGEKVEHIVLGYDWMQRMDRSDRLRGELDDVCNQFAARMLPNFTDEAFAMIPEDEWFRVIAMKAKRAKGAYAKLWMDVCFAHTRAGAPLGTEIEREMQEWRKLALKLALQTHHTRRRALDNRKHLYRNVAADLVKRAGLIGVENVDLRDIAAKSKDDGTENELVQTARKYRTWAAPSELRLAIVQTAKREKAELVNVEAADTTRTCSACGHVHPTAIEDLMFVCQSCSKLHDQDENASHNIRNVAIKDGKSVIE